MSSHQVRVSSTNDLVFKQNDQKVQFDDLVLRQDSRIAKRENFDDLVIRQDDRTVTKVEFDDLIKQIHQNKKN